MTPAAVTVPAVAMVAQTERAEERTGAQSVTLLARFDQFSNPSMNTGKSPLQRSICGGRTNTL